MPKQFVRVAKASDIPEGGVRVFQVDGTGIILCRVEGSLYAIEDVCSHDDGPLGEGSLEGFCIECPRHGARFDVRTGEVRRMPAIAPIASFPLKTEDGEVHVEIDLE